MFDSVFGNQVCKWQEALGIDQQNFELKLIVYSKLCGTP